MKGNNMAPTLKGHNQPPKELNDFLILDSDGNSTEGARPNGDK